MNKFSIGTSILSAALLSQTGCQKSTSSSTPKVTTSISMTSSNKAVGVAQNSNSILHRIMAKIMPTSVANSPPASMTDGATTPNAVSITDFWVVIKSIEFKAAETAALEGSGDGDENQFAGPYYVDMLSTSPLVLDTKDITSKTYHRVKMQLEAAGGATLPAGVPSQMNTNSLYINGSIAGGTLFSYLADDGTEIDIAGAGGVAGVDNQSLLITVKLAEIVHKIDFTTLLSATNKNIDHTNRVSGTNLCPLISSSATDYYTCFRKGIESEADMGEDSNGDHELSSTEPKVK